MAGRARDVKVLQVRPAGDNHQVIQVSSRDGGYCKKPCANCPWRKDAVGEFPAEAFKHSAYTAYDMATSTFACHTAGKDNPKMCAGFILHGSMHNLTFRLKLRKTRSMFRDVSDGGHELFTSYREMAIANGVDPDDPVLAPCRD